MIDDYAEVRKGFVPRNQDLIWLFVLELVLVWVPFSARAQDGSDHRATMRGVVWQEPVDEAVAAKDLLRMRAMGVDAVRTSTIESEKLLSIADTLGLAVFQELSIKNLPAARLLDSLQFALQSLTPVLRRARNHSSATFFGLALGSDTSDSLACVYLERAAEFVRRRGPTNNRVYYVTRFIEDDRCGHTVDFVLLDALGSADPAALLRRWEKAHPDVPAGIGAVGARVSFDAARGVSVTGSREAQARYLETHLRQLVLQDPGRAIPAVFVHQWRDTFIETPTPSLDLKNPHYDASGLFTVEDEARPAASVVEGMFRGSQTVFAFPSGSADASGFSVTTVAGWLAIVLLGAFFFGSPRFRQMVPRYFGARGFYREGVREGRDVLLVAGALLLSVISLGVGITWLVVLQNTRSSSTFMILYAWMPDSIVEMTVTLLAQPWMLLVLLSCIYAASVTIWSAALAFAARNRYPLSPAQAITLTTSPRWPLLLVMIAAMAVATLDADHSFFPGLYLLLAWFVITLFATVRGMIDYRSITRVPPGRVLALSVFNPFVLFLVAFAGLALAYRPEVTYLWHTIVRT